MEEKFFIPKFTLAELKSDLLGEEWLYLMKKKDRSLDEQNLKDRLKRILIVCGWPEERLDRLARLDYLNGIREDFKL